MQQPLERDLLVIMYDVARLVRTRFDRRARSRGMTRAQWLVLARLSRQPGISQNELASLCEVEPITVGRLVDRLEARGLIERRPDPADRRINRLHLLSAAKPVLEEIAAYREALNDEILEDLEEPVRAGLVDSLLRIKDKLTATEAEAPRLKAAGE